jgi:hypothetical protein
MHVCMCVRAYVYVHKSTNVTAMVTVCMRACVYVCMRACMYVCMRKCIDVTILHQELNIYMPTCLYVHVDTGVDFSARKFTYVLVYTQLHMAHLHLPEFLRMHHACINTLTADASRGSKNKWGHTLSKSTFPNQRCLLICVTPSWLRSASSTWLPRRWCGSRASKDLRISLDTSDMTGDRGNSSSCHIESYLVHWCLVDVRPSE